MMNHNYIAGRFHGLDSIINENSFITTDDYLAFAKRSDSFTYYKRDFIFKGGLWRGKEVEALLFHKSVKPRTLIVGHSDLKTNLYHIMLLKLIGYSRIAGVNTRTFKNNSLSLPLGMTNNNILDSQAHVILGDPNHFIVANKNAAFVSRYEYKFYVNFNLSTNWKIRSKVVKTIKNLKNSNLVIAEGDYSKKGRINYLCSLRTVPMVLCPEGNGPDTHRLWETLYMGGIPIVVKNNYLDIFFDNLPVITLSKWNDLLDKGLIEKKYYEAEKKLWNHQILNKNYWFDKLSKL